MPIPETQLSYSWSRVGLLRPLEDDSARLALQHDVVTSTLEDAGLGPLARPVARHGKRRILAANRFGRVKAGSRSEATERIASDSGAPDTNAGSKRWSW